MQNVYRSVLRKYSMHKLRRGKEKEKKRERNGATTAIPPNDLHYEVNNK